jgi:hypothetical protein
MWKYVLTTMVDGTCPAADATAAAAEAVGAAVLSAAANADDADADAAILLWCAARKTPILAFTAARAAWLGAMWPHARWAGS